MSDTPKYTDCAAKCKFCGKDIVLKIDVRYAGLGDPYNLIKLACCNHCGDLRHERRRLDEGIRKLCVNMVSVSPSRLAELKQRATPALRSALRQYQALAAKWLKATAAEWDEAILEAVLSAPQAYGDVLGRMWSMAKQSQAQAKLL